MEQLEENDGFSAWRKEEYQTLHSQVQSAITHLQNPTDCSRAKKLICHLNQHGCGLGCLIHFAANCLLTALATERVLIFSDEPWFYSNFTVKNFFGPVSSTCTTFEGNGWLRGGLDSHHQMLGGAKNILAPFVY